jgi:PAS domain-containing protein
MRDITRRKRYEAALRRNGERFRRIFNQSPIGSRLKILLLSLPQPTNNV